VRLAFADNERLGLADWDSWLVGRNL
jgi:hypothetical protein